MLSKHLAVFLLLFCGIPHVGCTKPPAEQAESKYLEALDALANDDTALALKLLDESLEADPTAWGFYQRAYIRTQSEEIEGAKEDCDRGLELDPKHADLRWLKGELNKPKASRFKGRYAFPPSTVK